MRPVDKAAVGTNVILYNGVSHIVQSDYSPYKTAKPVLEANLGAYCSYCECPYQNPRDYAVEHIQPKGLPKYSLLETKWSNFLLSCDTCNGADNKDTKDVILSDCHLPHLNNTFLSLEYAPGGVVSVNKSLKGISIVHAENLLNLVGLQKTPKTSLPSDKRWANRSKNWDLATKYYAKYKSGIADVDTIVDLVQARGGWSIWYTVFAGEDVVLKRLIDDFPGTCKSCFDPDNHYKPIERNPGNTDPI